MAPSLGTFVATVVLASWACLTSAMKSSSMTAAPPVLNATDYTFNPALGAANLTLASPGGLSQPRQLKQWPALAGQGISQTYFKLDACALRPPHVHMHATGMMYLIKGSRVVAAFVNEDSSELISNEMTTGASTFFPVGLVHYQQNLGCDTAEYVITYNDEAPGTQVTFRALAKTPFGNVLNTTQTASFASAFVTDSDPECMKTCGAVQASSIASAGR